MVMLVERLEGWAITKARGDDVTVVFERPPSTAIPSSVVEVAHAPKAAPTRPTTRSSGWSDPAPSHKRFVW